MNISHVHLLLDHFPTIGTLIGLALLVGSLISKNEHERRAGLGVLAAISVVAFPAFMSGRAAQAALKDVPGVSVAVITRHFDAAIPAFLAMQVVGALAWLGLWQSRRRSQIPTATFAGVLVTGFATMLLMMQAANLGGEIRHPEILLTPVTDGAGGAVASGDAAVFTVSWLQSQTIAHLVQTNRWIWPICEIIHYIGLCLLVGVVMIVNLRFFGLLKSVPFAAMSALLPWAVLGLGLNTISGLVFFIGAPKLYITNPAYAWKMVFLMLAGLNGLYLTMFADEAWALKAGEKASFPLRTAAACAIVLWAGVLYLGRMLPFVGNAY